MPNWRFKAYLQKAFSALPGGHRMNFVFQTILAYSKSRRGWMNNIERIILERARQIDWFSRRLTLEGARVVEVGAGWVPVFPIMAYLAGADSVQAYDIVRHIRFRLVRKLIEAFRGKADEIAEILGLPAEIIRQRLDRLQGAESLDDLFARANIRYIAPGDAAATDLADESVDLWYAFAVLQHVPQEQLRSLIREARRILKPGGRLYCEVGCFDDFAQFDKNLFRFDYLRYSDAKWRRRAGNNFYTANRMREIEYLEMFEQAGGSLDELKHIIVAEDIERCKGIPLDARFQKFTPEQNAVLVVEMLFSFLPKRSS
jgi:SAM-dependent methyltransferase